MTPVSLRYLMDRARYPRSRAEALAQLRERFSQLSGASEPEREVAQRLVALKVQLSSLLQGVSSCTQCNQRHPRPEGSWSGGYCCSAPTTNIFTDDEIAALVASGVKLNQLRPPNESQHGCVFRGASGCTISPAERPTICISYLCVTLELELARQGRMTPLEPQLASLKGLFGRFVELRAKRLEDEYFAALMAE